MNTFFFLRHSQGQPNCFEEREERIKEGNNFIIPNLFFGTLSFCNNAID